MSLSQYNTINNKLHQILFSQCTFLPAAKRQVIVWCRSKRKEKKSLMGYLWVFDHCSLYVWWFLIFSNDFYQSPLISTNSINFPLIPWMFHYFHYFLKKIISRIVQYLILSKNMKIIQKLLHFLKFHHFYFQINLTKPRGW